MDLGLKKKYYCYYYSNNNNNNNLFYDSHFRIVNIAHVSLVPFLMLNKTNDEETDLGKKSEQFVC